MLVCFNKTTFQKSVWNVASIYLDKVKNFWSNTAIPLWLAFKFSLIENALWD